ncbi:hypothetical protein [Dictyobacter arantiisoli]|uniref:Uncharacterized protein n=1 Tax=Dictyobacter arantiisoli TaxID=2014874 RepID=A0A5A5TI94_9CHLR|nr:hypothetical protein [Dictyobacter arantiisoli]GCF11042.1 hypothetical protein KDI_46060 [Dictyobacter arantiisoli]
MKLTAGTLPSEAFQKMGAFEGCDLGNPAAQEQVTPIPTMDPLLSSTRASSVAASVGSAACLHTLSQMVCCQCHKGR